MVTKVIHKTIPHLGLMLVPLLAIPRIIRDCEWARRLEHKRDRALRDLRHWWGCFGCGFEFFVGDAVGDH